MYLNIVFVLVLSLLLCPHAVALPVNTTENGITEEDTGSLNVFLNSDFVRTSVWPGIGPFQTASANHLVDPSGNQLTYSAVGKQISSCQLEMRGGSNEAQCMLNLQMSVDFLLESLGVKPGQIYTVNLEVNKNGKLLIGNNYNPIHTTIAPFIVSLQNLGINEGTDNPVYRVVVANQNLTSGNLDTSKVDENKIVETQKAEDDQTIEIAAAPVATSPITKSVQHSDKTIKANGKQGDKASANDSESQVEVIKGTQVIRSKTETLGSDSADYKPADTTNSQEESPEISSEVTKPVIATKPLSKDEQLKKDFRDVIQNWQSLKKKAVKERDAKLLSQALSGKALIRQTDAIKWLVNNHKFYELTPGGAKIEKVTALGASNKYSVYAEVKERTKYIDESSGQTVKDSDDTYKVNYTIEKSGDKWLITDSTLIKSTAEKAPDKVGFQKNAAKKPVSESVKPIVKSAH